MDLRIQVGTLVRVTKPQEGDVHESKWAPEMDLYEGRIMKVRSIEKASIVECIVTLEGAKLGERYWRFHEDWLSFAEEQAFTGFCDACSGFRRHKIGCPTTRAWAA